MNDLKLHFSAALDTVLVASTVLDFPELRLAAADLFRWISCFSGGIVGSIFPLS